ncbi:DUF1801 domain-containing protein [Actinospica sp. MGRD01-02]|uniref:DUF1801 domain-containing protein n=1 Tax=Actinospica acidithermotolerans TaxID=2828514 RepID=A0A941EDG1_9ACTN|nr:DUF1801 domain-containing protein [Actinospica acidithermotolerans]MBR7829307.1 DUF1801 domain-containing protein [Actinospica acidithermotolerans]
MEERVRAYIDAVDAENRPLFDRLHTLILDACPGVHVTLSYQMPTFVRGNRKLFLAAWRHGVSIYGWPLGRDAGFVERHPDLAAGVRTIRLRPEDAAAIPDEEFSAFARAALIDDPT